MEHFKTWVRAARLRTLPLSIAGILAGAALATGSGFWDPFLFLLLLATTLAYQVTSNFANDYGDGIRGTDNERRVGPQRVLQSGALSAESLRRGIGWASALSALLTLATLWRAFGPGSFGYFAFFLFLGALAIWAAIKYTVGSDAYGYRGLGDLFVFLFFGLLSVQGSQFLFTRHLPAEGWLPAIGIGALSAAVLNLNNLRDSESDREAGKNTLVVQWGYRNGVRYHVFLCVLAFSSLLAFLFTQAEPWPQATCLLPFLIVGRHLATVLRAERPADLDPELKKIALSTFMAGLLLFLSNHYFL